MHGSFIERSTDEHVRLRRNLLERGAVLPPPSFNTIRARASDSPIAVRDDILGALRECGLALVRLDEPLSNDRFTCFGSLLGTAMPERALEVKPYVEKEVILNLVSEYRHTSDVALQPFATNFLTLRTESSGQSKEDQPRYIVLMCCEPGDEATVAQTVLVPMTAVEQQLTESEVAMLSLTRYRNGYGVPSIVRSLGGRLVFSIRDFLCSPLGWRYAGDNRAVNTAIRALLASMYDPNAARGIHWTRGMLVVFDNRFFSHGRTAGRISTSVRRRQT